MKSSHPRITLLGSNSGNNLGDAAILASILDSVSKELPNAEFYVPTTNPKFVNNDYGDKYRVKGIDVMPWTASVRLAGIPTIACLAKSDIALICDGIIFGKKILNPTFNFLITLVFLLPFVKLFNCKLVCYSCGIGPFPSAFSRWCAKVVMNASDLVIMREEDSAKLAKEVGCIHPIQVTGDAAFINEVSSEERADEILKEIGADTDKPYFGINVTKYVDAWLSKNERVSNKGSFQQLVANGINQAKEKSGFYPIIFSTHPMDDEVAKEMATLVGGSALAKRDYSSHDLQSIMRRCGLFMGMRFHSLVLSSAVEAPIIGLVYAPKVRGYMRLLNCEELNLELSELSEEKLSETVSSAWSDREAIQSKQQEKVRELKAGARRAARLLAERYFPSQVKQEAQPSALAANASS